MTDLCTGLSASWCPVHGDCTCPRRRDGEPIPYGEEVDGVQGYDLAYPLCPLHGQDSTRPGVLLTSGDARLLRDQFARLSSLVRSLAESNEDALRRAHLFGYDPARANAALTRLSRAVELRDEPEPETAAG